MKDEELAEKMKKAFVGKKIIDVRTFRANIGLAKGGVEIVLEDGTCITGCDGEYGDCVLEWKDKTFSEVK